MRNRKNKVLTEKEIFKGKGKKESEEYLNHLEYLSIFLECEEKIYKEANLSIQKALSPKTKAVMIAHTLGNPFEMIKNNGVSYRTAGENIAKGQKTPEEVMNAWMNSPGHRANILNPDFTKLGLGVAKDSNGTLYWSQMFIG